MLVLSDVATQTLKLLAKKGREKKKLTRTPVTSSPVRHSWEMLEQ